MAKRQSNLELLRILSMIYIIAFHYVWNADYEWNKWSGSSKIIIDIVYMLGELGVNCFILISGYFMSKAKKPFQLKKAVLLWGEILFYSILTWGLLYLRAPFEINLKRLYVIFCPLTAKTWWYASGYFLLYLFSPYLNRMLQALEKKEYKRMICTGGMLWCVIPTFVGLFENNTELGWFYNRFIWMVLLYCIAGYIGRFGAEDMRFSWNAGKWFTAHVLVWAMVIGYIVIWERMCLSEVTGINAVYFWTPNNIVMVLLSITLFMTVKNLRMGVRNGINYIASTTFGIYLIHGGTSGKLWWNGIFHNPAYQGTEKIYLDFSCAVIVIFIVGVLVESVRKQLERRLIIPLLERLKLG